MKRKKRITRLAGKAGALLLVLVLLLTCSPLTAFASDGSADAQTAGAEAAPGGGYITGAESPVNTEPSAEADKGGIAAPPEAPDSDGSAGQGNDEAPVVLSEAKDLTKEDRSDEKVVPMDELITHELRIAKSLQYCTAVLNSEYISKDSESESAYDIYTIEAGTQVTVSFTPIEGGALNGNTINCWITRTYNNISFGGAGGVYTFDMTDKIWISSNSQAITPPAPPAPALLSAEPTSRNTVLKYTYDGYAGPRIYGFYREVGSGAEWTQSGSASVGRDLSVALPKNGVEYELHVKAGITSVTPDVFSAESNIIKATQPFVNTTGVTLNRTIASMGIGDANATQLIPIVAPSDASDKTLSWTSSDEVVATVEGGLITGVSAGTATITAATRDGHSAVCEVTVKEIPDTPANGSMAFGTADTTYDENGALPAEMKLTVTIPTNKAIKEFQFTPPAPYNAAMGLSGGALSDIKIDGQSFFNNNDITAGGLRIRARGSGSRLYYLATPAGGASYLEAGKTYTFDLTFDITGPAASPMTVGFGASGVFNASNYPVNVNATVAVTPEKTTGTINVSWNGSGDEIKYAVQNGITTYYLATAEQLLWFADEVNGGNADIAAALSADIDLTGVSFDGIGTRENPYTRNFDGGGHTVTYNMESSDGAPAGFIRSFKGGASTNDRIQNLKVKGAINVTSGSPNVGGLAGEVDHAGTISSIIAACTSEMTINVSEDAGGNIGGIVGYAVYTSGSGSGSYASKTVLNNVHMGTINVAPGTAEAAVGGIVGRIGVNLFVSRNENSGSITGRSVTGGIAGYVYQNSSSSNTNSGAVNGSGTSSLGSATGGIIGFVEENISFGSNNLNFGTVSGDTLYVGGIGGYVGGLASSASSNYNEGAVTSTSSESGAAVGGIFGGAAGGMDMTIQKNVNKGTVTATNGAVRGGVIGYAENGLDETGEKVKDNYFAIADGLSDSPGITGKNAQNLSQTGYTPGYSGTGGYGTAESPFLLATDEDIVMFAALVNGEGSLPTEPPVPAKDAYVKLTNDIDMSGYPGFARIGSGGHSFSGTFDGGGHKINFNIVLPSDNNREIAMFGACTYATVKNLTITGAFSGENVAALAYSFYDGTIENVTNEATISGTRNVGGVIVTGQRVTFKNVINNGTVTAVNTVTDPEQHAFGTAAGIASFMGSSGIADGCINNGDITSDFEAAGLFGRLTYIGDINGTDPLFVAKNCINNGKIESKSGIVTDSGVWAAGDNTSYYNTAGGIIGRISEGEVLVDHCTNNGDVLCSGNNAGGIVGCTHFNNLAGAILTITNSVNNGDIISTYKGIGFEEYISVGGILGNAVGTFDEREDNAVTISDCQNTGNVVGPEDSNVSSIVGRTNDNPDNEFDFSQGNTTTVVNGGDADNPDVVYVGSDSGGPVVPVDPGNGGGSHESPGVVAPVTPTPENPASASNTRYVSRPAATPREIDAGERPETLRVDEQIVDEEVPQAQEPPADNSLDAGAEDIERAVESSAFTFVAIGIGVAAVAGFVLFRVSRNRRRA